MDPSSTPLLFHPPAIPPALFSLLSRPPTDPRPIALQTCGLPTSGKSTLSALIASSLPYTHLSIDRTIFAHHTPPYPAHLYRTYQLEARALLQTQLSALIRAGKNVILDFAAAFKEDREQWRKIVEDAGGRVVLVHLVSPEEELWERVQQRSRGEGTAENAAEISRELLHSYAEGFEVPRGEGELVVRMVTSEGERA